jgi:hypothetical protein
MCTASWLHHQGYSLYFNRDELRTRKPAEGPEIQCQQGVRVIAPRDGDFGGSWISVNEYGMSLALLNRYEAPFTENGQPLRSRGLLLMDLAGAETLDDLEGRVRDLSLDRYRPFTLLALSAGRPAMIVKWNGIACMLTNGEAEMPLISSSYQTHAVIAARQQFFRGLSDFSLNKGEQLHLDYHKSHMPQAGPYSTCMHREDAMTVSFSHIQVDEDRVRFEYHPASPCLEIANVTRELNRAGKTGKAGQGSGE